MGGFLIKFRYIQWEMLLVQYLELREDLIMAPQLVIYLEKFSGFQEIFTDGSGGVHTLRVQLGTCPWWYNIGRLSLIL